MYEYPTEKRAERVFERPRPRAAVDPSGLTPKGAIITPEKILTWLRRGAPYILLFALLGGALGIGFGMAVKPRYSSSLDILLPPPTGQVVPNELTTPNIQSDAQILDISSKLLLIKSGNVLRRTVEQENLQALPEFNAAADEEGGPLSWLKLSSAPRPVEDGTIVAMRNLAKRITVSREGGTYLVNIGLWTRDPQRSVSVLSTLSRSFREELEATQTDLARSASEALSNRLEELRLAATEAAQALVDFRQKNNLLDLGGTGSVNVQSLSQLNTLMNEANSKLAEARARYERLNQPAGEGMAPADTLDSPMLAALRSQYTVLKQQYDDLALTYGERYPKLVSARAQLGTLRTELARETERSLQAVRIEMDQAQSSVDSIRAQLETARNRVSTDDASQVQLQELERNSQARAALYDTFLKRVGETTEQQQISVSNLRIVTEPVPPEKRSWPPSTPLLAIGGVIAGVLIGIFTVLASRLFLLLRDNNWRFERKV
ncbi:GumC family protein [Agrobacterium larrymoorei]|uniref:GumC family protein n=1 Tax=Agrobacterium larrymoorei TaxID=160699 RepID=UPI001573E07B|nr:GumC family protein [Agrobacterium larrymoorei]NTJ41909.1 GumC family protein [Agrobacterium larrymoorei]